jgi:hypothetical protein
MKFTATILCRTEGNNFYWDMTFFAPTWEVAEATGLEVFELKMEIPVKRGTTNEPDFNRRIDYEDLND